jgi:preprotein translocase subunit SecD
MNRYPLWKYLLVAFVVAIGALYAIPNLYPQDPSLQISGRRDAPDQALVERVNKILDDHGIAEKGSELADGRLLVRFRDTDAQLSAAKLLEVELGRDYVTALNIAPSTPKWLESLGGRPMYLGLDLRGGVHFLLEVDMAAVLDQTYERYVSELRNDLRGEKIRYQTITKPSDGGVLIRFRDQQTRDQAADFIADRYAGLAITEQDLAAEFNLLLTLDEPAILEEQKSALQQNIATLRNRVNELGVAEPIIQQQGQNRIVVQLPGVQDTARAKEILGATATLEFRMVNRDADPADLAEGKVPVGSDVFPTRPGVSSPEAGLVALDKRVMLTGDRIIDAASGIEQQSQSPAVFITLDGRGAQQFQRVTGDNVGKPMAVLFIENQTETVRNEAGELVRKTRVIKEVINIATIREQLSRRFQITGLDSTTEARDLALLLRAGALAAPIQIIEERTVGPSLGRENIKRGFESVVIGFALVLVFMGVYYKVFGLIANLALTMNLVLLVALLSGLQATLTMPGIAGIVLTVGMAVDANVLIFERMREELRNGNSPHASINAGYDKAFSTIADANITTLIAAVVLFGFGTGPIKGFAVTLSLGILTSMFTAILGTRAVVNLLFGGRRLSKLSV